MGQRSIGRLKEGLGSTGTVFQVGLALPAWALLCFPSQSSTPGGSSHCQSPATMPISGPSQVPSGVCSATQGLFPFTLMPREGERLSSPEACSPPALATTGFLLTLPAFLAQVLRDWQHQARSDWWLQAQGGNAQSGGQDC